MTDIDSKFFMPCFEALPNVLSQFGVQDFQRKDLSVKQVLAMELEVNSVIGLVQEVQGNIGFSMSRQTGLNLVSAMMGGMEVQELDDMAKSGLNELTNMLAAGAVNGLAEVGKTADITPPTLIVGEKLYMIISQVQTVSMLISSSVGDIEINVGLESVQ